MVMSTNNIAATGAFILANILTLALGSDFFYKSTPDEFLEITV